MPPSVEPILWSAEHARLCLRIPDSHDDKYSHGVLGIIAGSVAYPGAAVLCVEAAARAGVGMIRFFGPAEPTRLVMERRPETVTQPGRADAYVIGPGIDQSELAGDPGRTTVIQSVLTSGLPVVLDAGALSFAVTATGPVVATPHHRELQRMLAAEGCDVTVHDIEADPGSWAQDAADRFAVTVLLKGSQTHICSPAGRDVEPFHAVVPAQTSWMATAGTGDVLAGICGALIATHATEIAADSSRLGPLVATAAFLHASAGALASSGGPLVALDVAEAIPGLIASLL